MTTDDQAPEHAPDNSPAAEPTAKPDDDKAAADRRGFLHRLASFGLGEVPEQILMPRTRLQPADLPDTGD